MNAAKDFTIHIVVPKAEMDQIENYRRKAYEEVREIIALNARYGTQTRLSFSVHLELTPTQNGNGEFLYWERYGFSKLPPEIGDLQHLQYLAVNNAGLESLPKEIGKLRNLRVLTLNNNHLSHLPPEIGQLDQLSHLDIGSNKISSLPEEFKHLRSLKVLNVGDNKFSDPTAVTSKLPHTSIDGVQVLGIPRAFVNLYKNTKGKL